MTKSTLNYKLNVIFLTNPAKVGKELHLIKVFRRNFLANTTNLWKKNFILIAKRSCINIYDISFI